MVWSTRDQASGGWFNSNSTLTFGGVSPSEWSNANAVAADMSANKELLRTLFSRKGYGGKNAVVVADEWTGYGSNSGKHAAALFRIRNTTAAAINWNVDAYMTAYDVWGEVASVAVNGNHVATTNIASTSTLSSLSIPIPPDQTSTVIFVAGSGIAYIYGNDSIGVELHVRSLYLAFANDTLELPPGLEYVDDLDTATGGWDQ